jgi:hypothetical protein
MINFRLTVLLSGHTEKTYLTAAENAYDAHGAIKSQLKEKGFAFVIKKVERVSI